MPTLDAPSLPQSPAAPTAQHTRACPFHGMLHPMETDRCGRCGRKPYDLDDPDDRQILKNLRGVVKQRRMTWATLAAGALTTVVLGAIDVLRGQMPSVSGFRIGLVLLGALSIGIPVERLFRRFQPKALREVDARVLNAPELPHAKPKATSANPP